MPNHHWRGYEKFLTRYVRDPDFRVFRDDMGFALSEHFRDFIDDLMERLPEQPAGRKN